MPKFEQIEQFIEVCRSKSITGAAAKLFITQQSLSSSMKRLEADLGQKLFLRTSRGVEPTEAADRLYAMFDPIVTSYRAALRKYASQSDENVVSFAITPAVIRNFTPNLLLGFCKVHPIITLEMKAAQDSDLEEYVLEDRTHFGLITAPECILKEKYSCISLETEPLTLLVHNDDPLSKMPFVDPVELKSRRFFGITGCHYYLDALNRKTEPLGFEVTPFFESDDVANLFNLVEYGAGVMLCRKGLYREVQPKNCALVPFSDSGLDFCTAFVFQDYPSLPPLAKSYISFVQDLVRERRGVL